MAVPDEKKIYKPLENVLNSINKDFISLSPEEIRRNNAILQELLQLLTTTMKEKNNLFKEMYTRVFYGGSYYDGLRVGQPDEFDLDLLMTLPKVNPILTTSNVPGYIHLQLKDLEAFLKQPNMATRYKGLEGLVDKDKYLDNEEVRKWMESVVTQTLNKFKKQGTQSVLEISQGTFLAKIHKGGPAFTLKVEGNINGKKICLDIDLVPCFEFNKNFWPKDGFRTNSVSAKPNFFIVPKPLKNNVPGVSNRYWRLSFQEQERELIDKKQYLKPSIKLLKKMRDVLDHKCIASYYIKTVALWETDKQTDIRFWSSSLSYVFMTLLKQYYESLKNGKIQYYWIKSNNLIKGVPEITLYNMTNRIKAIIDDIEKHLIDDPLVVAKYLLTRRELENFKNKQINTNSNPQLEAEEELVLETATQQENKSCIIM